MGVGLFIYLFDITILQNYWIYLHAIVCKIILTYPKRFIALKKCGFD